MERGDQAAWRTWVQVLCSAGIALAGIYLWFRQVIWMEFFPAASDSMRIWCGLAAIVILCVCSFAEYASLRRLRVDHRD